MESHFAAFKAALQQRAASATIVQVGFMQDTVPAVLINPLFPSFAQNVPGEVIVEQSAGGAGLQHVVASSDGLHVGVEH